ncbi:MAG: hypothetical protein ABIM89_09215 [Mycobacteriales bacterium]
MEPVLLVVVLMIVAALALAVVPATRRRRTVHVQRDVAVRRVVEQPVVQTHVVRTTQAPVVEEIVEER